MSQTIRARSREWAGAIVDLQLQRQEQLRDRYGPDGVARAREDAVSNLLYLAEAVGSGCPDMFAHYVDWLRATVEPRGVTAAELKDHLHTVQELLHHELGADAVGVEPCLRQGLLTLEQPLRLPAPFIHAQAPHGRLAAAYLDALLHASRQDAVRLALAAVDDGMSLLDLYLRVLQPAQQEVGRLWQMGRISVADEHTATAITQTVMAVLYPRMVGLPRMGRTLVATCVGDELHDIGLRMVADLFELNGWHTLYVGANTPAHALVNLLTTHRADVLAISVSVALHLPQVRHLIASLRTTLGPTPAILVGGHPFNTFANLWQQMGANAHAPDAEAAVEWARRSFPGA